MFPNIRLFSLDYNSQPLSLAEALQQLQSLLPSAATTVDQQKDQQAGQTEKIGINEALGRIVAADITAPVDLPPFPASAMDGYALLRTDIATEADTILSEPRKLQIVGTSWAGHPCEAEVTSGTCVRVFTGAAVPAGADQVVLQEYTDCPDETHALYTGSLPSESFIRPVGHDIRRGQKLLSQGRILNGFDLGSLAAAGISELRVFSRPTVGVFSTGDELIDPGQALQPGQIYDSNRLTIGQLLRRAPLSITDLGRLPDDQTRTRAALAAAAEHYDFLITSGGVSVGDADYVTQTIAELGTLSFWKLNLKPGKPLAYGRINNCHIFGLPGNPVSTIVTLLLIAQPAILRSAGAMLAAPSRIPARVTSTLPHTPGRTEYQRGNLEEQEGQLIVTHTGDQSSNRLSTFTTANCLIEVPGERGDIESGETIQVIPFKELLI